MKSLRTANAQGVEHRTEKLGVISLLARRASECLILRRFDRLRACSFCNCFSSLEPVQPWNDDNATV